MTTIGIVHVHTRYSHDGKDAIPDLAAWARERGIRFVGITDHAEDLTEERWRELVAECSAHSDPSLVLHPGLEFRFHGYTGVHLLALGLTRWIAPTTPAEFIAATRGCTALTIGAHPVIWRTPCPDDVLDQLDAIEVWNGGYNTRFLPDPKAMAVVRALRERGRPTVATIGPDQHDRRRDHELRIVVAGSPADALREIRSGRFINRRRAIRISSDASMSMPNRALLASARVALDVARRTRDRVRNAMQDASR